MPDKYDEHIEAILSAEKRMADSLEKLAALMSIITAIVVVAGIVGIIAILEHLAK